MFESCKTQNKWSLLNDLADPKSPEAIPSRSLARAAGKACPLSARRGGNGGNFLTDSSYRKTLRSSSIIGGAQAVTILAGVLKMKVAAVVLGPAGVGLVGLYANLVQTAASIGGLGTDTSAVRGIASANASDDTNAVWRCRSALVWGSVVLSIAMGVLFYTCRGWVAAVFLADASRARDVGWLSIGVAATVLVASQSALLTGLNRIGDLARINVGAGVIGALVGVISIRIWPERGLLLMVLAGPLFSLLFGRYYVRRIRRPIGCSITFRGAGREWRSMAGLGIAFMLSGVVALLGQLSIRAIVQHQLGADALGQFQASWAIGMTYLSFVLGAMATDYYPRLTAAMTSREAASRLINEQSEVGILLCAPIVLGVMALSPWVVRILYAPEFGPAAEILRWQLLGDILKVLSWPLGFMQQARGAGKTFFVTETITAGTFVLSVYFGLPYFGVAATGIAFLVSYAVCLPLVWLLARRWIGFRWSRAVRIQAAAVVVAATLVNAACGWNPLLGAGVGLVLSAVLTVWGIVRLSSVAGAKGRLGKLGRLGEAIAARVIRKR